MNRKVFVSLFVYYIAASIGCALAQSDAPETWTYWVSGGKKGIGPRVYRDDEFAIGVSEGFVSERAVGFKENGGIVFLRSGKDIENPDFADPEIQEIGTVTDHKVWNAIYYRDEARKNVKAVLLLIADDDDQLHPFFFIAVTNSEKLSVAVEPNAEETKQVTVASAPEKGTSHRFAFTFPKSVPTLVVGDNKR